VWLRLWTAGSKGTKGRCESGNVGAGGGKYTRSSPMGGPEGAH